MRCEMSDGVTSHPDSAGKIRGITRAARGGLLAHPTFHTPIRSNPSEGGRMEG
jgi:hypothetical protein